MDKKGKTAIIVAVIALVMSIGGIAFAALSSTLTINGVAEVVPAGWDISFTNIDNEEFGSATGVNGTLSATSISGLSATLTKPGDKVVYTITLSNLGDIDAKLVTYTLGQKSCLGNDGTENADALLVCGNLEYSLTYLGGTSIVEGDLLPADSVTDSTKTLLLTVEYPESLTVDDMPENKVTITLPTVTFVYEQTESD